MAKIVNRYTPRPFSLTCICDWLLEKYNVHTLKFGLEVFCANHVYVFIRDKSTDMHTFAKFDKIIPCGSRDMSNFSNC